MIETRCRVPFAVRVALSALALTSLVLAAGCSSDDSAASGDGTTTTTVESGDARIDEFVVPESVNCNGQTSTKVSVAWSVSGGASQELLVDGRASSLASPSGTMDADVHCDPLPHTVVLHVLDDGGRPTTKQVLVTTNP